MAQEASVGMATRRGIELTLALAVLLFGLGLIVLPRTLDAPAYGLLAMVPQQALAAGFTLLGCVRVVLLVVNGHWPLSPVVRLCLSISSAVLVWLPLTLNAGWFLLGTINAGGDAFLPGAVLSPMVFFVELRATFALAALWEASRDD